MQAISQCESSPRLLIAEDNADLCRVIKIKLDRCGFIVETVRQGQQAIARIQAEPPTILVLDYRLPDLNGADLVDELRRLSLEVPFLVMTGEGDQATAVEMMKKGALDYLVKDQNFLDNLVPAVKRALQTVETDRRLRNAEEALRLSEERFQLAAAGSHDGIWDWKMDGANHFWWSPQVYELLGYEPDEVRIDLAFFKEHADSEHWRAAVQGFRRHLADGVPFEAEFRFAKKDGSFGWFRIRGQTIRGEDGRLKRMAGSFEDITHRKVAEEQRRTLETQLRQAQKMETIGTLAGGVAHDFNNILAAIYGYVALAERRVGPEHPAREDLEGIMQAAERARDLVQQILTFSRNTDAELKPLIIKPVVKESLRLMRASIPSTIDFETDIEIGDVRVEGDPNEIEQVIINLCTNAQQAMNGKPGVIRHTLREVEIDAATARKKPPLSPGRYVHFRIEDNGCGMDQNTLLRIWEPFFTTKNVGEGTGMGLAVVHGIVQKHRGAIFVDSKLGDGTRFDFFLPVYREKNEQVADPELDLNSPGEGRVLLVDDEEAVLVTTRLSLENLGYTVDACSGPVEAWKHFERAPETYDLLLSDFTMPHQNGLDLGLRARELRPDLPVLLMTGFSDPVTAEELRSIGLKQCLVKPFTLKTLASEVKKVLRSASDGN